jgi:predicted small secreted protein
MIRKTIALACISLSVFLTGCNTVRGLGQDVQKAGAIVENAAKK